LCGREIILKQKIRSRGYYTIRISENSKRKQLKVHRLVAQAFIPNPLNKPCVNHIDGNKLNNSITNLEWCTYKENYDHAITTGLMKTPSSYTMGYTILQKGSESYHFNSQSLASRFLGRQSNYVGMMKQKNYTILKNKDGDEYTLVV
jgi:hypothetical protein